MNLRRFGLFVVAGGTAAAANFGSRIVFSEFMPYVPAILAAYCIGMATAFMLNRLFVFRDADNALGEQALWFVAVNVAAVLQTILISLLLARAVLPMLGIGSHAETVAHAIGVVVPVFTSYYGHRRFSFKSRTPAA